MTDETSMAAELDDDAMARVAEAAARAGVSVSDYLADIVLHGLLQQPALSEPEAVEMAHAAPSSDNFSVRHRLGSIEKRLGLALGSMDTAVHGLDTSLL